MYGFYDIFRRFESLFQKLTALLKKNEWDVINSGHFLKKILFKIWTLNDLL